MDGIKQEESSSLGDNVDYWMITTLAVRMQFLPEYVLILYIVGIHNPYRVTLEVGYWVCLVLIRDVPPSCLGSRELTYLPAR